uniref:DUF5641 domain-containing protein n=1 Tax=Amphimedon queenslandica TaxID=400682 RepID=A0A1X7T472_AMPQE
MRHLSYTLDGFWKQWTSQYLIGLRENHSYITTRSKGTEYIEVGDIMRKTERILVAGLCRGSFPRER